VARVLVTGSTGTLGRPLVRQLRQDGHKVFGCARSHSEQADFQRADVSHKRQLDRIFSEFNPEYVYHLAAEFGRHNGEEYYETLWQSNVIGTRNVLECCDEYEARLIFASSSEVYGESMPGEYLHEGLTEDYRPRHSNEYAISKWTNELQIENFVNRTELPVTVLRFFNAYGPGEEYHPYRSVVALFSYRALSGMDLPVYEGYMRTFMYIDDFIPTLASVCRNFVTGTFNIGGTDYRSVQDMAEIILAQAGPARDSKIVLVGREDHNVVSKRPNVDHAYTLWGHQPTWTLEAGIPETVAWMKRRYGL
jgi:dTDP-glucose 4,6-dehydratase